MNNFYYSKYEDLGQTRRFSPLDLFTLLMAALCICSGGYLLYNYQENTTALRDLTPIAEVGEVQFAPKRKIVGTLSWNGIKTKDVLFRNDQILTDETSQVEVIFLNKTFLDVPPQSLIKLGTDGNNFDIELVKGIVDINLSDGVEKVTIRKGKEKYQLESKDGKVQVIGGESGLRFNALKGQINIKDEQATDKAPKTLDVPEYQYQLTKPLNRQVFNPLKEEYLPIEIKSLKTNAGSSPPPKVVISKNPDLTEAKPVLFKEDDLQKALKVALPDPGLYYVGVKEAGSSNFRVTPFRVLPFTAPTLLASPGQQKLELFEGEQIPLKWSGRDNLKYEVEIRNKGKSRIITVDKASLFLTAKNSENLNYRVRVQSSKAPWSDWTSKQVTVKPGLVVNRKKTPELVIKQKSNEVLPLAVDQKNLTDKVKFSVSSDPEFKNVLFEKTSKNPEVRWSKFKPGIYYWKAQQQGKVQKSTGVQKVVVKANAVKPDQNYKERIISPEKKPKVTLSWKEELPKTKYKLIVSSQGKSVIEKEVTGKEAKITLPSQGSFSWKVQPLENQEVLLDSKPIALNVSLPPPLGKPEIKKKQVIYYRYINGVEAYEIEMPRYEYAQSYYLEVFRDKEAERLVFKKSFPGNRGYWVSNRSGKYYYRVRVTDRWGRTSPKSDVGTLIFPISPLVK